VASGKVALWRRCSSYVLLSLLQNALRSSKIAGIRLPDGKRLFYSGYADDTTVYISDRNKLPKLLSIFKKFSYVSGMRLNVGKCTVIPMGILLSAQKPPSCPYRWLTDGDDLERLLGVPVGIKFENEAVSKSLLLKLQDFIKHWVAQKLTVYGRVHAARSYIGGKAWFLATMVPPDGKGLKRFPMMLGAFIQNNGKLQTDSNRHYSAWSRSTLIKPFIEGGLNAQDPELQMKATHSKWIFKLLDPRHIASWKSLPFHFFQTVIPGFGESIFLADPSIIKFLPSSFSSRWSSYLEAWLSGTLKIDAPPMDLHCILNEPFRFNTFLYLPCDKTHGRILKSNLKIRLVKMGFLHLKDLYSFSNSKGGSSPWFSRVEAIAKTETVRLGEALMSVIGLIPASWSKVVLTKSREPFQVGSWCIRDEPATSQVPRFIYKVAEIRSNKLLCTRYRSPHDQAPFIYDDINAAENIRRTDLVKACVLQAGTANNQTGFITAEITSIPNYCYQACHGQLMANQLPSLTLLYVCFISHLPQTILTRSQPSVNGREI
jgi:hypothetical protein